MADISRTSIWHKLSSPNTYLKKQEIWCHNWEKSYGTCWTIEPEKTPINSTSDLRFEGNKYLVDKISTLTQTLEISLLDQLDTCFDDLKFNSDLSFILDDCDDDDDDDVDDDDDDDDYVSDTVRA